LKQQVVGWILSNKAMPSKMQLNKTFKPLTANDLKEFKDCYEQKGAITLSADRMLAEEREKVLELASSSYTVSEISKQLLISLDVVQDIVNARIAGIRKHQGMLQALSEVTGHSEDELVNIIMADGEQLTEVLVIAYKLNTDVYTQTVGTLVSEDLSQVCKDTLMEKI